MISIRELQSILVRKEFNPYLNLKNTDRVLIHLCEEIGELAKAYRKYGLYSDEFNDELGDCQILLLFFASSTNTDLESVTLIKIRKNIKEGKFKPDNATPEGLGALFG